MSFLPQDEITRGFIAALPGIVYQFVDRPGSRGELAFLSEGVEDLLGIKPGRPDQNLKIISSIIHPGDLKQYREALIFAADGHGPLNAQFRIATPQGGYKWIQSNAKAQIQADGSIFWTGILLETSLPESQQATPYLVTHDQLTGLYNRSFFEMEISRREKESLGTVAIIVCDIDGLKLINDSFGHVEGDKLLRAAATIVKKSLRDGDIVARIGGDEIAAILPGAGESEAEEICHTIRENFIYQGFNSFQLSFSVSVGFAVTGLKKASLTDAFRAAEDSMGREKLHHTGSMRNKIIQALGTALEARDYITDGHATRLQGMALMLASVAGLPENKYGDLRLLARFHDIGKVAIPDEILFKPGPLTADEMDIMRKHSEIGHRLAMALPDLVPVADWILKHHEWWNGGGYPLKISGEDIPLECRIIGIVDAYDSMINDRPYRPAMSHREATGELKRNSGSQFDAVLVEQFIGLLEGQHFSEEVYLENIG